MDVAAGASNCLGGQRVRYLPPWMLGGRALRTSILLTFTLIQVLPVRLFIVTAADAAPILSRARLHAHG